MYILTSFLAKLNETNNRVLVKKMCGAYGGGAAQVPVTALNK